MIRRRKVAVILFLLFYNHLIFSGVKHSDKLSVQIESGNVYIGDVYRVNVVTKWKSIDSGEYPSRLEYKPGEGRKLLKIERRDDWGYISSNQTSNGVTTFIICIAAVKESKELTGKAFAYFKTENSSESRMELKITEPAIKSRIFGYFTLSELIFIITFLLISTGTIIYIVLFIKKKRKNIEHHAIENDPDRLELNALGRLLDSDKRDLFINGAFRFISRMIDLLEINESALENRISPDLKRDIQKYTKILDDAKFSTYKPEDVDLEAIYILCKDLYEIKIKNRS